VKGGPGREEGVKQALIEEERERNQMDARIGLRGTKGQQLASGREEGGDVPLYLTVPSLIRTRDKGTGAGTLRPSVD